MLMNATVAHDVAARIAALFVELPMLAGFTVQPSTTLSRDRNGTPLAAELSIADVAVDAWPGWQAGPALHDAIAQTLIELLNEHPESYDVLRGQTFARTFH